MNGYLKIAAIAAATTLGYHYVDHFLYVNNGLPFDKWPLGRYGTWDVIGVALLFVAYT